MTKAIQSISGQSFRDREGQRWWVKCPRPGAEGQFVVEAEMKGTYPRVAVYAMTEREFREHARNAELKPEHPGGGRHHHHSEKR
jgi:hypothetical protein